VLKHVKNLQGEDYTYLCFQQDSLHHLTKQNVVKRDFPTDFLTPEEWILTQHLSCPKTLDFGYKRHFLGYSAQKYQN
jgi:hypothetical protein